MVVEGTQRVFGEGETQDPTDSTALLRRLVSAMDVERARPDSFGERLRDLASLRESFEAELADRVGRIVSERIASMPQRTFRERKAVADTVNDAARRTGLAVTCPGSRAPCTIEVVGGDDRRDAGIYCAVLSPDPVLGVNPALGEHLDEVSFTAVPGSFWTRRRGGRSR